ncbi:MAG: type II toxin-antitoxin system RelE/ParE family toxin [Candidatus Planktophila sp.]|nr:type II toxin-antitoxin system RelE/ParE family toxin [Candidatus Planktophila sp.]
MSRYTITVKKQAEKYLHTLPKRDRLRIIGVIELLGDNPLPPKALKLTGREGYRIRVGDYRIIYSFSSKQLSILIIKIGNRKAI